MPPDCYQIATRLKVTSEKVPTFVMELERRQRNNGTYPPGRLREGGVD